MTTQEKVKTHVGEPIDQNKGLSGNDRKANISSAPPEVQQKVVEIIIEEARKRKFNNRDLAYYIAIAKRESGFNPDAANATSTASGIAQVIDKTGKTYGINDQNRFDARSSIKAGLDYFIAIKKRVIKDYGLVSGEYEPLIYYCYHYGEFIYYRDREHAKDPKPIGEIKSSSRYEDSKTVCDEAARIEKILNSTHGLQIQLTDLWGKALPNRKVIAVLKKPKPTNDSDATPQPAPQSSNTASTASNITNSETSSQQNATKETVGATVQPVGTDSSAQPAATGTTAPKSASCDFLQTVSVEYELVTLEFTTDSEGNIPDIETDTVEPVMILIPRINYEEYNEALQKQLICEEGNKHTTETRGDDIAATIAATPTQSPAVTTPQSTTPATKPKTANTPKAPAAPSSILDAAAQDAAQKPLPPQSPSSIISFNDVVIALRQKGWKEVYETSFSYIKQFYTKPKLGTTPLDNNPIRKAPPSKQTINSSLPNKEIKTTKVKEKVTTAEDTALQPVEVHANAPWMTFALAEQRKDVAEKKGNVFDDSEWKEQHKAYKTANASIKKNQAELKTELKKDEAKQDRKKITTLEEDTKQQEKIRDEAVSKMQEREEIFNQPDIIKYHKSTEMGFRVTGKTDADGASDDTSWCSSFVNWCVEQSSYRGTGSPAAKSWLKWGTELPKEKPKYGAITVVYRGTDLYHVGFFTGIAIKNEQDGYEEVEAKDKNGNVKMVKKQKFKQVEYVRLLSGNMTNKLQEMAAWSVENKLVSYRWPTAAEKK